MNSLTQETLISRASIIAEALPYISRYAGKTIVVKYGGNAMNDDNVLRTILQDIATLKMLGVHPVLVHGGGPEINANLAKLGIASEFKNGLRVTSKEAMDVVQMTLAGRVNKNIVGLLGTFGVKAVGLCGKDASLIEAEKMEITDGVDYGYAGRIVGVHTALLNTLRRDYVPVIASVGVGKDGEGYNINADLAAGAIGGALGAEKLVFLTDVDGIRADEKDPSTLISQVSVSEIEAMIKTGKISGGMLPKVGACVDAINKGIGSVLIINGTIPHSILLELFTQKGVGTMVTA
ncbi:MAG: acetylglutamate kinase [Firmicutes bacterium]|nr:acetylglutamate kinase [Bacillota bacterium]